MSFISATFSSDPLIKDERPEDGVGLLQQICDVSHVLRKIRIGLRFGAISRAPLHLLRFEMSNHTVECDWMARSPDPWDVDLARKIQQRHASIQALQDAIDIRALIFDAMPQANEANLRVFREKDYMREVIIAGSVHRLDQSSRDVHSIVMRAKVLGFRFRLEDEVLQNISEGWR